MSAVGALLGLGAGTAALVALSGVPALRRPRLADRLSPYLDRDLARSRRAPAPLTPFPTLERLVRPAVADLAALLDRRLGGRDALARRLSRAGSTLTPDDFRAEQVLAGALGLLAGLGLVLLAMARGRAVPLPAVVLAMVVGAVAGAVVREHLLDRAITAREQRMTAEFPTLAELLAFAVAAGEGAAGALARVAGAAHGDLGQELAASLAEARAGATLIDAMRSLADRTGLPVVRRFVDGVVIALERGTPLADVLRAQAADARAAGSRALLERAGRREIAMLVPVVFLVLPAVVVVVLFPGFYGVVLAVP